MSITAKQSDQLHVLRKSRLKGRFLLFETPESLDNIKNVGCLGLVQDRLTPV